VAAFCTKCGAGLTPGVQFCTACGAPAPVVPVPPTYPQAGYVQPVGVPVQPASGSSAVKIILIVLGVVVGLGLLSAMIFMFSMWRLSRAIHVNNRGDGVTLSTKDGSITTGSAATISAADLGVPIYPGATRREGGVQINSGNGSMVTAVFSTTDSMDKVVDFYRDKVGANASVMQSPTGSVISSGDNDKQGIMITVGKDASSGVTSITIIRANKH
jgi:hypothetical protein